MAKFEAPIIKEGDFMTVEFLEEYEDLYGKCCWRARPYFPATFYIQILHIFRKFKVLYKLTL